MTITHTPWFRTICRLNRLKLNGDDFRCLAEISSEVVIEEETREVAFTHINHHLGQSRTRAIYLFCCFLRITSYVIHALSTSLTSKANYLQVYRVQE